MSLFFDAEPFLHQILQAHSSIATLTDLLLEAILSSLPLDPSSAPDLDWPLKFNISQQGDEQTDEQCT
jgi:hypothetical protein